MSLSPGTRLGPYEIIGAIGAGAMGEVYRARDTKLNRDAAIKVLPDLFAADPERLARFEREAQVLASLNHANIAQIYGIENLPPHGGSHATALIMELVDGEDLAERLARGPIPFDEALPIAAQIADALEAAHQHGIVHRDLKPANIKVRSDGVVKVLDFGLAKALDPAGTAATADAVDSPTLTARVTRQGVILGTAAYMSPEQARGKPVDKRADIWAFGCVLYEMLTGTRPFVGDDVTDTMAAVVRADPDWSALPAETPAAIRTLLRRCLEKDRRERLPDIGAARLDLKDARLRPEVEPRRGPAGPRPAAVVAWAGAAALLGAAIAGLVLWRVAGGDGRPAAAEFIVLPPEPDSRLSAVAVSPDGRALAFVAERQGRRTLWIRGLDAVAPRPVAGGDGANYPFWSPDGRWLAFFAQGKLHKVASAGGPVQTLCDAQGARGGAWGPGDIILFAPNPSAAIHRVSAAGGTPTPVTTFDTGRGERSHRFPSFLPDGRHFLYNSGVAIGTGLEVHLGSLDGGPPVHLFPGSNPSFADGHLLYVTAGTLMAQPFDAAARRVTGEPRPLARGLTTEPTGGAIFSANAATLVHLTADPKSTLSWFDRGGARLDSVASELDAQWFNLSPNGDRLVISARRAGGSGSNIWVVDLARRAGTVLTAESADYGYVSWSSDGAAVVYAARSLAAGASLGFFAQDAGGARPPRALVPAAPPRTLDSKVQLSPDGRLVLFVSSDEQNRTNIWALETSGDAKPIPIASVAFQPELSPDGRWLAYSSTTSGRSEIMIQDFPAATRRVQLSTAGGSGPRWRGDMKELFYVAPSGAIMSVPLEGGSALTPRAPVELFTTRIRGGVGSGLTPLQRAFAVTRDGQRFLIPTPETDFPDSYLVTLNWRARLDQP